MLVKAICSRKNPKKVNRCDHYIDGMHIIIRLLSSYSHNSLSTTTIDGLIDVILFSSQI